MKALRGPSEDYLRWFTTHLGIHVLILEEILTIPYIHYA